jgi:hypothetical protein
MTPTLRSLWRLAVAAGTATVALLVGAVPAFAQVVPDPAPDAGLPGGALITQVLGCLKYASIASAVAGLLIGGISTGVGHFGSSYSASSAGRKWILGGIGTAMLGGLAHSIAATVTNATRPMRHSIAVAGVAVTLVIGAAGRSPSDRSPRAVIASSRADSRCHDEYFAVSHSAEP